MNLSEAFLVNTKNFDAIIDALVKYDADEVAINSDLLKLLGYSDPNDLLVIRLLKDLDIINNDGKPSTYFEEFQQPETTKKALAKGLLLAYEELFSNYPKIHQASQEKVREAFEEIFKGKKTDLIVKYISGTFYKVVNFVGAGTIDAVQKEELEPVEMGTENLPYNGSSSAIDNSVINETVGDLDIDDFVTELNDTDIDNTDGSESKGTVHQEKRPEDTTEENPFGFDDEESNPKADMDSEIDTNPTDLNTSMTEITQLDDTMNKTTTEHAFVQKALLRKSDLLHKMKRWDELAPTLEQIIKRYDNTDHPNLKEAVSRAVIRRATTLLKLNRSEEALPALSIVISRFKDSDIEEFYNQASQAMLHKAVILEKKQDDEELLPLYSLIINRLDNSSEIQMVEKMDNIHMKRFDLITRTGDDEQILEASLKLIARFRSSNDHQDYLQKAMIKRAEILDAMNRDEEALQAYDEFLATFGG